MQGSNLEEILKSFYYRDFKSFSQNLSNITFLSNQIKRNENKVYLKRKINLLSDITTPNSQNQIVNIIEEPFNYDDKKMISLKVKSNDLTTPVNEVDYYFQSCFLSGVERILGLEELLRLKAVNNYNNFIKSWMKTEIKSYTNWLYTKPTTNDNLDKALIETLFKSSYSQNEKMILFLIWEDYFYKKEQSNRLTNIINFAFDYIETNKHYFSKFNMFDYDNWSFFMLQIPEPNERMFNHLEKIISFYSSVKYTDTNERKNFYTAIIEVNFELFSRIKIQIKLKGQNDSLQNETLKFINLQDKVIDILLKLIELSEINPDIFRLLNERLPKFYSQISKSQIDKIYKYLKENLDKEYDLNETQLKEFAKARVITITSFILYCDQSRINLVVDIFKKNDELIVKVTKDIIKTKGLLLHLQQESIDKLLDGAGSCEELLYFLVDPEMKYTEKLTLYDLVNQANATYISPTIKLNDDHKLKSKIAMKSKILDVSLCHKNNQVVKNLIESMFTNKISLQEFSFWFFPQIIKLSSTNKIGDESISDILKRQISNNLEKASFINELNIEKYDKFQSDKYVKTDSSFFKLLTHILIYHDFMKKLNQEDIDTNKLIKLYKNDNSINLFEEEIKIMLGIFIEKALTNEKSVTYKAFERFGLVLEIANEIVDAKIVIEFTLLTLNYIDKYQLNNKVILRKLANIFNEKVKNILDSNASNDSTIKIQKILKNYSN